MLRRSARALRVHTSNYLRPRAESRTLEESISANDKAGEDATKNTFQDFIDLQGALLPYRFVRLGDEINAVIANPSVLIPTPGSLPFFGRLVFMFFLGWFMTRGATLDRLQVPEVSPAEGTQ